MTTHQEATVHINMAAELKKTRSARKSILSRSINDLRKFMVEEDVEGVKSRLASIKEKLAKFEEAHDQYLSHVTTEADDVEIEACDSYYNEVHERYVNVVTDAKSWLSECVKKGPMPGERGSQLATGNSETPIDVLMRYTNLPKIEIAKFDGNPLKYHSFIAVFDETVDASGESDKIKLTRLLQYTSDKANDAISSCVLMQPGEGYKLARKILLERFGNDHLVTQRIVHNLIDVKQIRSATALQEFSDEVNNSYETLKRMNRLAEVESQGYMIKIIERLQPYLKIRWKRKAMEIKDERDKYPEFRDLVQFIQREAKEASDPVYGGLNAKSDTRSGQNVVTSSNYKKSQSFTSKTNPNQKLYACVLCKGNHRLYYCKAFKEMRPQQRLELVVTNKLCENCFLNNHKTRDCFKEIGCTVPGCNERHNKFIHVDGNNLPPSGRSQVQGTSSSSNSVRLVSTNANTSSDVHMPIVPVKINDSREVCALLDTGASNSFCSRELIESLGIEGTPVTYSLSTLNADENITSKSVSLKLSSLSGEETLFAKNVFVMDKIPVRTVSPNVQNYEHLKGLQFVAGDQPVHLLIGQDNAEALVPLEIRKGKRGEPFASKNLFGWAINGADVLAAVPNKRAISHFVKSCSESDVERLWNLENEGLESSEFLYSQNEKRVLKLWEEKTEFIDGHYQIPIPWKDGVIIPNNLAVARSRLFSLKSSLDKRGLTQRYHDEIVKLLESEYAEVVPIEDIEKVDKVWYLPHHAVINEKKPDKLRIVFDCASRFAGESLNDKCHQGPDLTNKLLHILLRFRQHEIVVMADVESMYYQVRVPPEDRDVLRFVWFDSEGNVVHYKMKCHIFGGRWCSSSATYALRRTVTDNSSAVQSVSDAVFNDFYVDDFLKSVSSVEEAVELAHGVKELLAGGGFNLTKYVTNNEQVLSSIAAEDRAKEVKQLDLDSCSKALGIRWNVQTDELYFVVQVDIEGAVTRKSMLSTIASIYDPLGMVSPMIIVGKLLFQEATRLKYSWDEELPSEMKGRWIAWLKSLEELSKLRIRRCVKPRDFDGSVAELHHFSDASERAYGSCSYLRCINEEGAIHTTLILSKCRVAPIKGCVTIPRLEMLAAVMAAQVDALLRRQLDLELLSSHFWVDSEIVLKYINNETRRFKVFIANRVGVIRDLTNPDQWHHISGSENPADVLSRGGALNSLDVTKWYDGPEFLRCYKSEWQSQSIDPFIPKDNSEVRREVKVHTLGTNEISATDKLLEYYSSWYKLKRAVCWFMKFKEYLKRGKESVYSEISVHDLKKSELAIITYVQHKCYVEELKHLKKGQSVSKSSSVKGLSPFLDERGLLRVGGRLKNASLSPVQRNPYLIPHSHVIANLIARDLHEVAHLGTEWVVSLIRKKFWVTNVRKVVKSVSRNCFKCKRLFASPNTQFMADLPSERVQPGNSPFVNVGMDCFGPFLVKQGRSQVKRFGCIFTCFACRGIHLEVLAGLDTESFINGLKRFVARRGRPRTLFCDNGKNFIGAKSELARSMKSLDLKKIENYALFEDIEWKFNPPYASHMGGVWERLIRTTRKVLVGLFDMNSSSRMSDDMLQTLFCEVEGIVNSRPLTKVSDDVLDDSAITPNHMLMMREHVPVPPGQFSEADLLRKKWRAVQHLANVFWSRWLREYIPELQRRCKWVCKTRNFKPGDLVLLCDEHVPRGIWPMGVIEEVKSSDDGLVRSAKIKTKSSSFVRPISKLILLECSD